MWIILDGDLVNLDLVSRIYKLDNNKDHMFGIRLQPRKEEFWYKSSEDRNLDFERLIKLLVK